MVAKRIVLLGMVLFIFIVAGNKDVYADPKSKYSSCKKCMARLVNGRAQHSTIAIFPTMTCSRVFRHFI